AIGRGDVIMPLDQVLAMRNALRRLGRPVEALTLQAGSVPWIHGYVSESALRRLHAAELRLVAPLTAASARAADTAASVTRGLAFGRASGRTLKLDLYRPGKVPARGAPVIVWIHGGGFFEGTRAEIGAYAAEFARRGYLSLSVDYRLHTERFVTRGGFARAAPALLAHGTRDGLVPYRWALQTRAAYRRAGVSCTLVTYQGVGHELGVLSVERRVYPVVARWLARR